MSLEKHVKNLRLGIDLGGTKIEAIVLDHLGQIVAKERVPTPSRDYQELLVALAALVRQVEQQAKTKAGANTSVTVGMGIPGSLIPGTDLVRNANLQVINGKPLAKDLGHALGQEVRIENDANCFALSEAVDGAGRGAGVVFGVIIGTGCGGGLILNQKIWRGPNSLGGEWGHNRLPDADESERPGPPCYCGHNGCVETFVSGTGFRMDFLRATGRELSSQEIIALAEHGDPAAEAAIKRLENRLARSLAVLINTIDPEVIVLGGGLSNLSRLYQSIPLLWEKGGFIFGDARHTRLRQAVHGDSSGVRGAAWLWE